MKVLLCLVAVFAAAKAGVLSGAHDFGHSGGSYFSSAPGGGSSLGDTGYLATGGGSLLSGALVGGLGGSFGSGSLGGGSFAAGPIISSGGSGGLGPIYSTGGSGGHGPVFGSGGHGPVLPAGHGVRHYNLNLPVPNQPGLTYTTARAVQVLRPATLRVVARPVSVNVVKTVAVEEHAPRAVSGTLLVNKPTTVTVAKPVSVNLGSISSGSGYDGGYGGGAPISAASLGW